jgi:S1-C subfamily serine protease
MTFPKFCSGLMVAAFFSQASFARITLTLPPEKKGGSDSQAIALPVDTEGHYVTVGIVGADVSRTHSADHAFSLIAQDPQSRCTILKGPIVQQFSPFGSAKKLEPGSALYWQPNKSGAICRVVSWETTFHGRQLPLSFLRVHCSAALPKPGQPFYNETGDLVAIAHQATPDFGNGVYALPIEAITRNLSDYRTNKSLKRCWLGLHLDHLNPIPAVEGIRPKSPSAKVGLKKGDILISLGEWSITTYSSAINAFYYLLPGQKTDLRILRGTQVLDLEITPLAHPSYSVIPKTGK